MTLLVNERLLFRHEVEGEFRYEMAHEYMLDKIARWIDQEDLRSKKVEEMLIREVINWRTYGTLIPEDRLKILCDTQEGLNYQNEETLICLLNSMLEVGLAVEEWVEPGDKISEDVLLAYLNNEHEASRRAAIQGLSKVWKFPELSHLGDDEDLVRILASDALGIISNPLSVQPLIATLDDRKHSVSESAAKSLGKIGSSLAVDSLIKHLFLENTVVALGLIGDERAVEPIIGFFDWESTKEETLDWRKNAATALGQIGNKRAVEALIKLATTTVFVSEGVHNGEGGYHIYERPSNVVRSLQEHAFKILGQTSKSFIKLLINALQQKPQSFADNLGVVLGQIGEAAVEPLIDILRDKETHVRSSAAKALGQIGDPRAVQPLIDILNDSESSVRSSAAKALGQIGDPRAVQPLIRALKTKDQSLRSSSAEALGKIGDLRAIEPLVAALKDRNREVHSKAANALGLIGEPTLNTLLIAFENKKSFDFFGVDTNLRGSIAQALGVIGSNQAVELLITKGLKNYSNQNYIRGKAATALAQIGDTRAVGPLIDILKWDKEEYVRSAAAEALGKIGDIRAILPLLNERKDKNRKVQTSATRALERDWGVEAVEILINIIRDLEKRKNDIKHEEERKFLESTIDVAISTIRRLREPAAIERLIAALDDANWQIRKSVIEPLGEMGDARAVEPLLDALHHSKGPTDLIVKSLGQIGDVRAINALLSILITTDQNHKYRYEDIRQGTLEALRKIGPVETLTALGKMRS